MMIDYTKESKINMQSAAEKLSKDLTSNNCDMLGVIDVKKVFAEKLKVQ